jgi:ribonuclease HI
MDTPNAEHYKQKLEEFEAKYGAAWVKKTYGQPPKLGNKFYAFALQMNKAYEARELGLIVKDAPSDSRLSPGLMGSLNGFNGVERGKKANTPALFYRKWEERMLRKKGNIHREFVREALLKKEAVLSVIERLYINRNVVVSEKLNIVPIPPRVEKPKLHKKKIKLPPVLIPHGNTADILKLTHDVYYTDGGTTNNGTPQQLSRIGVFKNGDLFHEENIGNKTNNEAEYQALIVALKDIKGHAVIYCDSQLIVKTFLGEWQTKEPRLAVLRDEARKFMNEKIAIEWIPREENIAGFYLEEVYHI